MASRLLVAGIATCFSRFHTQSLPSRNDKKMEENRPHKATEIQTQKVPHKVGGDGGCVQADPAGSDSLGGSESPLRYFDWSSPSAVK